MNLYKDFAKTFSQTRTNPWEGWKVILDKYSIDKKSLSILDLGCGNGRFIKFLIHKDLNIERYIGIDSSEYLLGETHAFISRTKIQDKNTLDLDLNRVDFIKNIEGKFNLIVAFGILHHLDSFDSRKNLLENATKLLTEDGLLVVTYWQFANIARYKRKMTPATMSMDKFAYNDFTLPFGTSGALRFCHYTSDEEIAEIESSLDLKVIDSFYSDGKENNENLYKIYKL